MSNLKSFILIGKKNEGRFDFDRLKICIQIKWKCIHRSIHLFPPFHLRSISILNMTRRETKYTFLLLVFSFDLKFREQIIKWSVIFVDFNGKLTTTYFNNPPKVYYKLFVVFFISLLFSLLNARSIVYFRLIINEISQFMVLLSLQIIINITYCTVCWPF